MFYFGPTGKYGLDSGLDSGLDFGLDFGLDPGLDFIKLITIFKINHFYLIINQLGNNSTLVLRMHVFCFVFLKEQLNQIGQ